MKSKIWVQLGALAVVMVAGWPAQAEDDLDRTIRSLAAVREFRQVTISPDGSHVVWVESLLGKDDAPSPNSAIYVSAVESSSVPYRITAASGRACEEHS